MNQPPDSTSAPITQPPASLGLFDAVGVELEYMIVDRETLDVRPICDQFMYALAGAYTSDFEPEGPIGVISYSNELAMHIVELKTQNPAPTFAGLSDRLASHVRDINKTLAAMNARLLPTAMHPWMDPFGEMRLWSHDSSPIYEAFHRIFDCRGHGWANLQSTHLNLPFASADQFARLHAAIRLVLPLIPALAASSPIIDGRITGIADNRINVYRHNCARVPTVTAHVIPEAVFTPADYRREILEPMFAQIAPLDTAGILQQEWLNARGAIARFDRGSIEIRLIDIQECPAADIAIAELLTQTIRHLTENHWSNNLPQQQAIGVLPLATVLNDTTRLAENARINDPDLLAAFGLPANPITAGELWAAIVESIPAAARLAEHQSTCKKLLTQGTLATRITRATGHNPSADRLRSVYRQLADCLNDNHLFEGDA